MKKSKNCKISEYLQKKNRYSKMFDSIFQNQIYELSKQGHSIRAIARKLEISRQSVRKYIKGFQVPKAQDSFNNYLKINKETIKNQFFEMNGHCVPLLMKIQETYDGNANLRGLQIFCKQFRKELNSRGESTPRRYETQPGDHLQIDFGEKDVIIAGNRVRIHFFVGVLGYSRRVYVKAYTAENHQEYNARSFEKNGAALVLLEKELKWNLLLEEISKLLDDSEKLKKMSNNSRKMGKSDSTKEILKEIEILIRKSH